VINTFKKFGLETIKDDHFLTVVGSVSAVFGGLRFLWSHLVDRYSFKLSYTIVLCVNVIFGGTLVLVRDSKALFLIWVSMIVWAEGAHFALVPTICAKSFGKHASIVYGVAFSFGAFSQIVSSVLVRFMLKTVGYETFYYIATAFSLISLIILRFIYDEKVLC
jgi:MFS family permease